MCKALKKDKSVNDINLVDPVAKKRLRKQVIEILSEVLDHRQAAVKQKLAKKL